MARRSTRVLIVLCCVALLTLGALPAAADTTTSLGSRSGEGSTPFTGLAHTPEANLFTGASSSSVKIEIPPGRKNLTPNLVLQYSSSGGPSPYGFGWDLPLGRIQRSTKWGVPRPCAGAHTDEFVLSLPSGSVELIATSPGADTYRPKVEESIVEVTKYTATNQWVAYDRSGMKYVFGDVASARVGNDTSVFQATNLDGSCRFTTVWGLTQVVDPNQNSLSITYVPTTDNVLYPQSVDYGGRIGGLDHFYHVVFSWSSTNWNDPTYRWDHVENDLNGAQAVLTRRLTTVKVTTDVPPNTDVRTYTFTYDQEGNGQAGYRTILSWVDVTGGDPRQIFVHAPGTAGLATQPTVTAPYTALRVTDESQEVSQTLLDMNRDGMVDLVQSTNTQQWNIYLRNRPGTAPPGTDPGFAWAGWTIPGAYPFPTLRDVRINTDDCTTQLNGDFTRCVEGDTLDLNGDGIPDKVAIDLYNTSRWLVYYGYLNANPSGGVIGGFSLPAAWAVPPPLPPYNYRYLRVETGHTYTNINTWYSDTPLDLIDMNGDGRPDLVVTGSTTWQVYLNTGSGFESTPLTFAAPGGAASLASSMGYITQHDSTSQLAMLDFNGDGLPDLVRSQYSQQGYCDVFGYRAECLDVFYNTGQGFAATAQVVVAPYYTGIGYTNGNGETVHDLADVNGDGLPDWIEASGDQWMVALNQGDGFEQLATYTYMGINFLVPPRAWSGGAGPIRKTTTSGNPHYTLIDFFDIDGDGSLDRVNSNWSTAWTAETNQNLVHDGARPNLLQVSRNGLGGTTTLLYGPSSVYDNTGGDGVPDLPFTTWVTTKIVHNDGVCDTPCTGHDLSASYWYQDGRYDASEREFRGFRVVYRVDADNNWTLTAFGQDTITKGKVIEVDTYAGGYPNLALVRVQKNTWGILNPLPNTQSTQLWLAANATFTCDQLGGITCNNDVTNALIHYERNDPPDPYGNITHTYSCGAGDPAEACGATAADRVDTYVEYAQAGIYSNVRDKPKHTWSSAGAGGAAFAEKWFFYDGWDLSLYGWVGFGNPTEVYTWLDQTTGAVTHACPSGTGRCTKSTLTYDSSGYGNIIEARDANNIPTVTVYESQALLYPSQVIRYPGNGVTLTTTTVTDYRWGKPTSVTDPNGAVTSYEYDSAGRLSKIKRPLEDPDYYSTLYTYTFGSKGQYSSVRVRQREPNQRSGTLGQIPDYLTTTEYFDGLGRHHHSAAFRVVDGADQQLITGRTQYDAGGRVFDVDDPYPWAGDPAAPGAGTNGTTSYRYNLGWTDWIDPLGRPQCVWKPDGTTTCTLYAGVLRSDADEEWNWTKTTFNTHGRVVRKDVYHGDSVLYTSTTSGYDSAGRLAWTKQNDNAYTTISLTYDSLGRKIRMVDPDSGTWQYRYDAVGNLVYQEDPKASQHVQFCYDGVNRVTKKFYFGNDTWQPNICGTAAAITYSYDTTSDAVCPLGRLGSVTDTSGSTAFTYDCRGRTTKTTKAVTVSGTTKTAPTQFTYDLADHLKTTTYPDGEAVTTCYGNSGQPKGLSTSAATPCTPNVYATSAKYDLFGRLTELTHAYANGAEVKDTRTFYGMPGTDLQNGHRLASLKTQLGSSTAYLDLSYVDLAGGATAYTPRGLLKGIRDNGHQSTGDVLSNKASLTYDLGRLTSATVYYTTPNPSTLNYQYDPLGNLTNKEGVAYTYGNPAKPHQVTQVGSTALTYDPNGNVYTGRDGQVYTFDKDDRLQQISTSSTLTFLSDYTGRRVAKKVGSSSVTRYYSDLFEGTNGELTKYYFLGGLRVASQRVNSSQYAALSPDAAIQVAAVPAGHAAAVVLVLRRDVQFGVMAALCVGGMGLLLAPWRRKRVVGIAVHHGHVIGVIVAFTVVTLPWPLALRPLGPATAEAQVPTPILHYHVDHLGSTQVITQSDGTLFGSIRYTPYGEERYRSTASCATYRYCHEFTGYDTEPISKLEYAGARYYDPVLGIFLTHDPARSSASPYSYAAWNPMNHVDVNGEFPWLIIGIAFAIGFATAAIQAGVNGADFGQAMQAGLISGAVAGIAAPVGLGVLNLSATYLGSTVTYAIGAAMVGAGGYGTAESFRSGQYVVGAVGAVLTAFGLYGLSQGPNAFAAGVRKAWAAQGAYGTSTGSAKWDGRYVLKAEYTVPEDPVVIIPPEQWEPDLATSLGLWTPEGSRYLQYHWNFESTSPPADLFTPGKSITLHYRNEGLYKQFGHWIGGRSEWHTWGFFPGNKTIDVPGFVYANEGVWMQPVPFYDPATVLSPYPANLLPQHLRAGPF